MRYKVFSTVLVLMGLVGTLRSVGAGKIEKPLRTGTLGGVTTITTDDLEKMQARP